MKPKFMISVIFKDNRLRTEIKWQKPALGLIEIHSKVLG